eukprot:228073_1
MCFSTHVHWKLFVVCSISSNCTSLCIVSCCFFIQFLSFSIKLLSFSITSLPLVLFWSSYCLVPLFIFCRVSIHDFSDTVCPQCHAVLLQNVSAFRVMPAPESHSPFVYASSPSSLAQNAICFAFQSRDAQPYSMTI